MNYEININPSSMDELKTIVICQLCCQVVDEITNHVMHIFVTPDHIQSELITTIDNYRRWLNWYVRSLTVAVDPQFETEIFDVQILGATIVSTLKQDKGKTKSITITNHTILNIDWLSQLIPEFYISILLEVVKNSVTTICKRSVTLPPICLQESHTNQWKYIKSEYYRLISYL